jgi:hypothetical protein
MTNYGPSHFIQPHQKAGILHFPLYSLWNNKVFLRSRKKFKKKDYEQRPHLVYFMNYMNSLTIYIQESLKSCMSLIPMGISGNIRMQKKIYR